MEKGEQGRLDEKKRGESEYTRVRGRHMRIWVKWRGKKAAGSKREDKREEEKMKEIGGSGGWECEDDKGGGEGMGKEGRLQEMSSKKRVE